MVHASRRVTRAVIAAVLVLSVAGAAAATPPGAAKKKKKKRVVEAQYVAATGVRGASDTPCVGEPLGCVVFPVKKGEKFVAIDIQDMSGEPVWASVYIYGYSDGTDTHEHVCGRSDASFRIGSGVKELVVVLTQTTGGVTNPCAGPATTGTVKATLSNRA